MPGFGYMPPDIFAEMLGQRTHRARLSILSQVHPLVATGFNKLCAPEYVVVRRPGAATIATNRPCLKPTPHWREPAGATGDRPGFAPRGLFGSLRLKRDTSTFAISAASRHAAYAASGTAQPTDADFPFRG